MSCDIIMPVWDQLEVTRACINSIAKNTDYPCRIIIIDNGSRPDTENYLKGLKRDAWLNVLLIRNSENLGFVKAVNQGIAASSAPYLCIMNNDTIATAGWLKELVYVIESDVSIGLVNPSSNTSGQFPGKDESVDDYALTLKQFKGLTQELYTCRGFCMLMKRNVIEKVGLLDGIYSVGYFEETDYCKRAHENGFIAVRAKASYVYHLGSVSFKTIEGSDELFRKNEEIFFKRWGRPLRVGYFIDRIGSKDKIDDIARGVARAGHQINIFLRRGLEWPVGLDHFDIRRVDVNSNLFGLVSLYKIFKRRKKKKLDVLVTDNILLGKTLETMKPLHGSDVLIAPDSGSLLKLLETRTRQF